MIFFKHKRLRNKKILEILKWAKEYYLLSDNKSGLCLYLSYGISYIGKIHVDYESIRFHIPEFNKKFLNGTTKNDCYWWPINDRISRIEALDKLIGIYEQKLKRKPWNVGWQEIKMMIYSFLKKNLKTYI